MSVNHLPGAVITAIDLRHSQNVVALLGVDAGRGDFTVDCVCQVATHVRRDEVDVAGSGLREGLCQPQEDLANADGILRGEPRAEERYRCSLGPSLKPRLRITVVERDLG